LRNNHIRDISFLKELRSLSLLNLSNNQITDYSFLKELKSLSSLDLSYNQITDIFFLKELKFLSSLDLRNNQITDISFLKELKFLTSLDLGSNEITNISFLKELKFLTSLYLRNNEITDISFLKELKSLTSLDLSYNKIKEIPKWLADFNLKVEIEDEWARGCINLYKNPIKKPPAEIVKQGNEAIKDWYKAERRLLNEIKIILIGEAKAGKTSVIKKLKENFFDEEQAQTDGIVIENFDFKKLVTFKTQKKLHGIKAYFWDFGGQEIMKATHQFFLTKRCIYLLVLEARRDSSPDKEVRKWLEHIKTFGGGSPVIIIGNKIDLNPAFGIDTPALQDEFKQVARYLNVSCKSGENIERLKNILEEFIPQAELFKTEIDERWLDIKTELQEITGREYKLSHNDFIKICKKHKLEEPGKQKRAIQFLHDLGIVLHFDEINLAEYYVLDPLWVTNGVYNIITSNTAARQKGIVDVNDMDKIVNEEVDKSKHRNKAEIIYSPAECLYLAEIMNLFKLCYFYDNKQKILIPDLLDKETPSGITAQFAGPDEKLRLIYDYKYLPPSIFPRFLVEMNIDIEKAWRSGVIMKCKACINGDAYVSVSGCQISIIVTGEFKQKREYLSVIRYYIDSINSGFDVVCDLKIPLTDDGKHCVKRDVLLKMEKKGRTIYENWDIKKDEPVEFEIRKLLEGIAGREEIQKKGEEIKEHYKKKSETMNTKIFLSYASKERDLMKIFKSELEDQLAAYSKSLVEIWTDSEIDLGENWEEKISTAIENSDAALLLVSARFLNSKFILQNELAEFLKRKKESGYKIIPVLVRDCAFQKFEELCGLQFFKTYGSEYEFDNEWRDKILPFEELADVDKKSNRLINKYAKNLSEQIITVIKKDS
jgi:small GTP-binding protein